ncbi:MAG: diacylglycerol kinase [Anaeromyxobacter sp.]|nr:diacylglycerol kinase [Anaeromyxobacter sp.]MBL0275714.1 diacylglycerol kinase [Anaeromyxobacter sp.]
MGGIGIVNNPRAARNRRHPETRERLARLLGDEGQLHDASTPEELDRAVAALRAAGVDTLGICGGDGTNRRVLTAAAAAWGGGSLPRLLVLRGGTMNVLSANHGPPAEPEAMLSAELARRRAGQPAEVDERDLLRIEADGQPPGYGFLFGTGAAVAFLERFDASRWRSPAGAGWLLARAALSALGNGPLARALTSREPLRVEADGDEWPDQSYLTVLAGTVPSLGLGMRALARCEEQPGFFHAVGVHGSLPQVARLLPRVHRGAPWRRRAALDAVCRTLQLDGEGVRYMVDGDLLGPARALRLSTGPAVQLLRPAWRTGGARRV